MSRHLPTASALGAVLAFAAAACAAGPRTLYPAYSVAGQQRPVVVWMDIAIVQDIVGDVDEVDVPVNLAFAAQVMRHVEVRLRAKGFRVERLVLTSVGALADATHEYRVVNTAADRESESRPRGYPPFYRDAELAARASPGAIEIVHRLLTEARKERGAPNPVISLSGLSQGDSADVVVLAVQGRMIDFGKQMGQMLVTALLTGGRQASSQQHTVAVQLHIVNGRTGEVMWSDRSARNDVPIPQRVAKVADEMIARLP